MGAIGQLISCIGICWFGMLAIATPYEEPGRWQYVAGLALSLVTGLVAAGFLWKTEEK